MIHYDPFWETLKQRNISTYQLRNQYHISNGTLCRMRKNLAISTATLNQLCLILQCRVEEIMVYIPNQQPASDPISDHPDIPD